MNTTKQSRRCHGTKKREQAVAMDFSFIPAPSWPEGVMNEVADLLAEALVKDLQAYPISETARAA